MGASFSKINTRIYDTTFLSRYNYLSSIYQNVLPNDIKEVFKWVNFIMSNVPMVQSALNKMSSIAITSINYMSTDLTELDQEDAMSWKSILEDKLNIQLELKEIAFNYLMYGNQFISINFPIDRTMVCESCGANFRKNNPNLPTFIPSVEELNGEKKLVFKGTCTKCGKKTIFTHKDNIIKDPEKIKIIKWPVNRIDIYEDEITGVKTYYYTPSESDKELLSHGNIDKVFHLPTDIITAAIKNGKVRFNEDSILHLRTRKFNASTTSWGIPMLTSAIPDMISLMLLRKTNERIYSDMILPLRGVVPRVNGVDQQPMYNYMGGGEMKSKIEGILKSWKKDPTGIKFFPIPLEPISLFGEGKSLNLAAEIDNFSTMIMTAIGVPPEFVKGGLSYGGAGASLRVLQNQLIELTTSMEKTTNFITQKISSFINKSSVRIKLIPIKMIDDAGDKQNMLGLYQSGKISGHTALNFFDIDYRQEQERLTEEQKNDFRRQKEFEAWQQTINTSLEDKIKQESMTQNSNVWNLNQTAMIQEADSYAQEFMQLDYGARKSKMDGLSKENPVLYALVKWRMEFMDQKNATEAKQQMQQQ